mmetsp:Transcript_1749/g.1991  ORF Transcript_1749/g.1991 Transcript_1749/m.1991 type:complete len:89 (-) Transcript_1749:191-457(-)
MEIAGAEDRRPRSNRKRRAPPERLLLLLILLVFEPSEGDTVAKRTAASVVVVNVVFMAMFYCYWFQGRGLLYRVLCSLLSAIASLFTQ